MEDVTIFIFSLASLLAFIPIFILLSWVIAYIIARLWFCIFPPDDTFRDSDTPL